VLRRQKLPKRKIETKDAGWEDILDEIEMDYLPIEYISNIVIKFKDGTTWDINIDDSRKKQTQEEIEDSLDQLFEEYDTHIETLDFRLDLERVKHDVSRRVYKFLKLNK
jgi:hypothetical protein